MRLIGLLGKYGKKAVDWAWANKGRILNWLNAGQAIDWVVAQVRKAVGV
nr:aureocin A53 family class IId bacteriocin [Frondihabitans sp. VKM Ac-2883]